MNEKILVVDDEKEIADLLEVYQQHGKEFLICSLGSQSDSSRYDDVNYILKTIDESDYLTK